MYIQNLIKQAYLDGYAKGEKCNWVKPQSAKDNMANHYAEKQVKNIAYEPVLSVVDLREKLLSMRFLKQDLKDIEDSNRLEAYGFTECINEVLVFINKYNNA